jgi:hypothetical protein
MHAFARKPIEIGCQRDSVAECNDAGAEILDHHEDDVGKNPARGALVFVERRTTRDYNSQQCDETERALSDR